MGQRWPKGGGSLGGASRKLPPLLGATLLQVGSPPPPLINRGGGAPLETQFQIAFSAEGLPLSLPLFRSNLHNPEGLLLPPLYSGGAEIWMAEPCRIFHTVHVDQP